MSRTLRVTLITLGVLLLLYGAFYLLGRPAIPLPTIRYPVPQGQTLHDLVLATGSEEIKLNLNTKGSLNITSAGEELVKLNFTPQTLATTLDLALKLAPGDTFQAYQQFVDRFPVYPYLLRYTGELFFHVVPVRFSVIMTP